MQEVQIVDLMDVEKAIQGQINKAMNRMRVSKLYFNEVQAQKHAAAANALLDTAADLGLDWNKMREAAQKVYEESR